MGDDVGEEGGEDHWSAITNAIKDGEETEGERVLECEQVKELMGRGGGEGEHELTLSEESRESLESGDGDDLGVDGEEEEELDDVRGTRGG
jgi:hypothetical protein